MNNNVTYPYEAVDKNGCRYKPEAKVITVPQGSVNVTAGDEDELRSAIFERGPVSVCYQVVGDFRGYKSGVYSSSTCKNGQQDVNHAVTAVGFGTDENGVKYWAVKNSWGAAWGEQGYFKIARGLNMCGIAVCNSYPADIVDVAKGMEILKQE